MAPDSHLLTDAVAAGVIRAARHRMIGVGRERVLTCLGVLSEDEIWHRPNENGNSVGNLILHLCGNVRQWIVSGLGGERDTRRRSEEFSERGPIPKSILIARLNETLDAADATLRSLDAAALAKTYYIQGSDEVGVDVVIRIVEHFSYHAGQIAYFVKSLRPINLGF